MSTKFLEINGLKRHYEMVSGTVKALDGVDLKINAGDRILLLGPSGSGKTTLLNCIAALDSPTSGSYIFDGESVPILPILPPKRRIARPDSFFLGLTVDFLNFLIKIFLWIPEYFTHSLPTARINEKMTTFRRENIGYIFQFFNLLQDLTVLENILLIQELSGGRDEKSARELLRLVGLNDEIERFPTEISGGQQQRVAIARSLAKSPKLLLGDELTGNLDSTTSAMVMEVLVEACKTENITTVMVSHDESLSKYANRVIRLDSGRIVADDNL